MDDQTVIASSTVVAKPLLPEVPGYTVERLLGKGGMAEVFLAEDILLGRKAAIKMINLEGSMDADFRQRFEDEARTVAGFSHPNIITVYGFGEVDGKQYIAMSFESGGELDDKLREGEIDKDQALQITAKLAAALAYSHQRGIVHRDIKPANVLFDEAGSPVLSDFGIAKELDAKSGLTQTGMAIGSPAYMSPEQLMGQKIDGKTDVYSLGLVLFQMLHGRLPPNEMKMSQDPVARQKMLEDALGSDLQPITEVLARCFEFAPENRPSAGELAAQLQAIESTRTSPTSKLAGMAVGGALLAGIVGMGVLLLSPPSTGKVELALSPESASLLIDGELTSANHLELDAGSHSVVLLAPGYEGVATTFNVAAAATNNLRLSLSPLAMPEDPDQQTKLFHTQMDPEVAADAIDYSDISFPVFLDLLKLKEASFEKTPEQIAAQGKAFQAPYLALAEQGDALAQIRLLLADSEALAPISGAQRQRYKSELGNGDYPLGTFYAGFLLRTEAAEAQKLDIDKVKRYHGFLKKAQQGGFNLAGAFIPEAETLLRENGVAF